MRALGLLALGLVVALAGCKREDMYTQGYSKTWDSKPFFRDGSSMRAPVAGTVARDAPNGPVPAPAVIDAAMLARGRERYDIFCSTCHGRLGNGNGMIVQRGFPPPPSLIQGTLRTAKASVFYSVITDGYGEMYSFASRVPPADRWAIIAYIRALQLSRDADPASLPPEDRARLEAAR